MKNLLLRAGIRTAGGSPAGAALAGRRGATRQTGGALSGDDGAGSGG